MYQNTGIPFIVIMICSHVSPQINELFKHILTSEINAKTDTNIWLIVLDVK